MWGGGQRKKGMYGETSRLLRGGKEGNLLLLREVERGKGTASRGGASYEGKGEGGKKETSVRRGAGESATYEVNCEKETGVM